MGCHLAALASLRDALARFRAMPAGPKRTAGIANTEHLLGSAHIGAGEREAGRRQLRSALGRFRSIESVLMAAYTQNLLAELARAEGDLDEAAPLYERAARDAREVGGDTLAIELNLALVELTRGRWSAVRGAVADPRVLLAEAGRHALALGVDVMLLCCAAGEGRWDEWDTLIAAIDAAPGRGVEHEVPQLLERAAGLAAEGGEPRRAAAALRIAAADLDSRSEGAKAAELRERADRLAPEAPAQPS